LTLAELQARLVKIDAAIDAIIEGGASESRLNDQQVEMWVKKLSLTELRQMRKETQIEIAAFTYPQGGRYVS